MSACPDPNCKCQEIRCKCHEPKRRKKPEPVDPCDPKLIKAAVLLENNKYRRMHCALALIMKKEICTCAQAWADHLAANNMLYTRPKAIYGENIVCVDKALCDVPYLMQLWYQEKYNYDYKDPGFDLYTGHFTQMIWWESRYLGVGVASNDERIWIVCNYQPAGNIAGHFKDNVLPRKIMLSDSDSDTEEQNKDKDNNTPPEYPKVPCNRDPNTIRRPCEATRTYQLEPDDSR